MSTNRQDAELTRDAVIRELSTRKLRFFVEEFWNVVEPKKFVPGWHIDAICDHLEAVTRAEIRHLCINIPPRSSKSLIASVIWPVWDWLITPTTQFMYSSYASTLSIRDAVKSRRLIQSPKFNRMFRDIFVLADDGEALKSRYSNNMGGYRISTSVGGSATGDGGDKLVFDDPHNMAEIHSDVIRQGVLDWYDNTMRSRLNDPKRSQKVIIAQRGHDNDLSAHALKENNWTHLEIPMEYSPSTAKSTVIFTDPRKHEGELMCPERIGEGELADLKEGMTERDYQAQFQQKPTGEDGLIIKRSWWRLWPNEEMPECYYIIQVYDTAFEQKEESSYSARTTWGIFDYKDRGENRARPNCILLERMNDRLNYPELRAEAMRAYREYKPDWILIEKKASGHSLSQELRRARLPIRKIPKQTDKVSCAHMSSIVPEKGRVWYPNRKWADEVIEQTTKFPMADHSDMADTCFMAWMWMRRLGDISFRDEDTEDMELFKIERPKRLYG